MSSIPTGALPSVNSVDVSRFSSSLLTLFSLSVYFVYDYIEVAITFSFFSFCKFNMGRVAVSD